MADTFTASVIRIGAAGLGAAVAGPLGGAIGGWLGDALGGPGTQLVKKAAEKFGEQAGEKLWGSGEDLLLGRLKDAPPNLAGLYRAALRSSLARMHAQHASDVSAFADWFANWDTCLGADVPLDLQALQPGALSPENLDPLFRQTLERLDAQGSAIGRASVSLTLVTRTLPDSLAAALTLQLPAVLNENFAALVITPGYEQAWKQTSLQFEQATARILKELQTGVDAANAKLDALGTDLKAVQANAEALAVKDKLLLLAQQQVIEEKAARDEWQRKYLDLLAQSGPTLQDFLAKGDLAGAAQFTKQKIENEKAAQARNYFDYGSVAELQFHFSEALDAYREAWKIKPDPEYGFRYGFAALVQNRLSEAISAYEALAGMDISRSRLALALNNLGALYRSTHRTDKAEEAWLQALKIHRDLAQSNADAQDAAIATALNNLGTLYGESHRLKEAEPALLEALAIRRKLIGISPTDEIASDLASTLNNLSSFVYVGPDAEHALAEALQIRRELAKSRPEVYLPSVALTLTNVAQFCKGAGRPEDAEKAYAEAISIRSKLAKANPEAYNPSLAFTLNALGDFYRERKRNQEAERAYLGALNIRGELARKDSAIYSPVLAETLNSLGYLYHVNQMFDSAEPLYLDELRIYEDLDKASPGQYLAKVSSTQNMLGVLYGEMKRPEDAEKAFQAALDIDRRRVAGDAGASLALASTLNASMDLASTLNNAAAFYSDNSRPVDAKNCCDEAEKILEPLSKVSPKTAGELLAKVLWSRALLAKPLGESVADACVFAQRALSVAVTQSSKQELGALVKELCE